MVNPFVCNQEGSDKIMIVHCQGSELRSRDRKMKMGPRSQEPEQGSKAVGMSQNRLPPKNMHPEDSCIIEERTYKPSRGQPRGSSFPFLQRDDVTLVRQCQHTGHSVLPSCESPWGVQSRTLPLAGSSTTQAQYTDIFLRAHTWPT